MYSSKDKQQVAAEPLLFQCEVKHIPLKRIFDIAFSVLALFFLFPLFILIFLSIRLSSSGKAIYLHKRIGRGGRAFWCCKFRTMYCDADKRLEQLLNSNPNMKAEWEQTYKLKSDPRVTPIGHFLRRTSLDEIPQFWNVLKGNLSVVGPRPVVQEEINRFYGEKAYKILSIRPGITGLWQVSGRSDTSYRKRVQMDENYVDTLSLFLDLKVVLQTVRSMVTTKGAY